MIETTLQDSASVSGCCGAAPVFPSWHPLPHLGIGANAAVFSWVEGILFRPYPAVTHQERLLASAERRPGRLAERRFRGQISSTCKGVARCLTHFL